MRRRLVWAFSLVCTATVLAACGDAGDHFGEFRKNPPSPAVASKIAIAMPIIAGPKTPSGNFKLYVTAYTVDGTAVPVGTQLQNPIVVNSNDPKGVLFGSSKLTVLQFTAAPGPISVSYKETDLEPVQEAHRRRHGFQSRCRSPGRRHESRRLPDAKTGLIS